MNHMKEVAKLLGVEIGEKFYLKGFDEEKTEFNYVRKNKHVLKNDGIYITDDKGHCDKSILLDDVISGKLEIVKLPKHILDNVENKPILTDKEKDDLYGVIRTFRNKIIGIVKYYFRDIDSGLENISIIYYIDDKYRKELELPPFPKDSAYKEMHNGVFYSLEELGL